MMNRQVYEPKKYVQAGKSSWPFFGSLSRVKWPPTILESSWVTAAESTSSNPGWPVMFPSIFGYLLWISSKVMQRVGKHLVLLCLANIITPKSRQMKVNPTKCNDHVADYFWKGCYHPRDRSVMTNSPTKKWCGKPHPNSSQNSAACVKAQHNTSTALARTLWEWQLFPRCEYLPSPSLTWNLKMMVSKSNLPFQGLIFRWTSSKKKFSERFLDGWSIAGFFLKKERIRMMWLASREGDLQCYVSIICILYMDLWICGCGKERKHRFYA